MKDSNLNERLLVLLLAGVQFTHIMDFMVLMPLGPQLMRVVRITPGEFSLLVSAYTLSAAAAAFLMALFIDRFDRRHALLFLYAGFVVSTLMCGLAPDFNSLLLARIFAGAFGGVAGAAVHAIIGDVVPPERRGSATGTVSTAFSFAAVAGVPVGLYLAALFNWRAPFLFLVVASTLLWIAIWRMAPSLRGHVQTDRKPHSPWRQLAAVFGDANHRRALALPAVLVFGGFSVIPMLSPYAVRNVGVSEADLGTMYFFGGLATAFTSRWIGRLSDRHGKRQVFAVVAGLSTIPFLVATNLPPVPLWGLLCSSTLFFILVSGRFVPAMALVNGGAQPGMRGSLMSFSQALQHLSSGLAALCAGAIVGYTAQGTLTHYWVMGLIAVASTLVAVVISRKIRAVS